MRISKVLAIGLTVVATYSCKEVKKEAKEAEDEMENAVKELQEVKVETVKFAMEPKSDSNVKGEVTFTDENGQVKMTANFTGLTPGEHAIHIHEKADCSAADGTSTGGHWNPTNEPHGKWGAAEGYHKGDIGNFVANADGTGSVEFDTDQWCLGCDDPNKDLIGKGVIVHQGVDDFTTQPTGNAGGRISCTGIIQ
ncbi:MAG: superoxide dismutase family protein [Flavobacteriaceae bacterium]